jgi:hypothetical protein
VSSLSTVMSKRGHDDADISQHTTPKRVRNPTGFRVARPPVTQSTSQSESTATSSHIRTLVLGSNGRLSGRRKDKSHLTSNTQTPSTPAPILGSADLPADLPEDVFLQEASIDVQTKPKPKRKRNNTARVCDSSFTSVTPYSDTNSL